MNTLADKIKTYVGFFSAAIGQNVPIHPKSFMYVVSRVFASIATTLESAQKNAERENLAWSASLEGLKIINRDVLKRDPFPSTSAQMTVAFTVASGAVIPVETQFLNTANGIIYRSTLEITGAGSLEQIPMIAVLAGSSTTPVIGQTVEPQSPVNGITTGTVSAITEPGIDEETEDEYRQKTVDKQYSQGGGSNLADYRAWGQEVLGVARVYPYTGKFDTNGNYDQNVLLAVSVYVKSSDPTGIPNQALLDSVKSSILKDSGTQQARPAAGIPSSRLYVMPISYIDLVVRVAVIDLPSWTGTIQAETTTALANFCNTLQPFIEGLDPVYGRVTEITSAAFSDVIYSVAIRYGLNLADVSFEISGNTTPLNRLPLPAGKLPRLNSATYAEAP